MANEGKTIAFSVRIEPSLRDGLGRLAGRHGVKSGRYLRRMIREAQTTEPQFFPNEEAALRDLATEVRAVGRNINQIAKRLNMADDRELQELAPTMAELSAVKQLARGMKAEVARLQAGATERHIRLQNAGAGR